jgi:hypothetical protein
MIHKVQSVLDSEQVSVLEVKQYARITDDSEDSTIARLIRSARSTIERRARISIDEATIIASFSAPVFRAVGSWGRVKTYDPDKIIKGIRLPSNPIRSIESVVRIGSEGTYTYVEGEDYYYDSTLEKIHFVGGVAVASAEDTRVEVTYKAGYD